MTKDYSEVLKKLAPFHKKVVSAYNAKISSKEFACYRQGEAASVLNALYNAGGGLTAAELQQRSGVSKSSFDIIVKRMKSGTTDYEYVCALDSVQRESFNFSTGMLDLKKMNQILPKKTLCLQPGGASRCMVEYNGRLYLWCHENDEGGYSSDVLAEFDDPEATIKTCEKEIADAKSASAQIDALEPEAKSLQAEIDALGFFKFKQKKPLKERLAQVRAEISAAKVKIDKAEKAEESLNRVCKVLDSVK